MRRFGLIGKYISYSFSKTYFSNKFESENITDAFYENFDLKTIDDFKELIKNNPDLVGLNVTIPYKEKIISNLDILSTKAQKIGAVNTVKITNNGQLIGFNTDCYGFEESLKPLLEQHHKSALILGTGGASKAIAFVLENLKIDYKFVSRNKTKNGITYNQLNNSIMENNQIIINCTPLGTFPNINNCPDIPYDLLKKKHLLYDLIYNPSETLFLKKGKTKGAKICNGLKMLELQAEKAWEIWNKI